MNRILLTALMLVCTAAGAIAQEKESYFDFGGDSFRAGSTAVLDVDGVDDLFMAGETVRVEKPIAGSAHLAGRKVFVSEAVGGDAYVAGMELSIDGAIAGNATVAGYSVRLSDVGGNLRVTGSSVEISGPVAGYALIAADEVEIDAVISGDVSLTAREIDFDDGARIEGTLTLYEEKGKSLEVPTSIVPADRVERRPIAEWSEVAEEFEVWSWQQAIWKFVRGVILVAALAALVAVFVPDRLASLRRSILDQPFRNLLFGFLAVSALIGSTILLMMTLVGLLLTPLTVLTALLSAFAGYVVGAYAVGVGLTLLAGRPEPDSMGTRAIAAAIGALAVAVIGLIPFFGWLFVLALSLSGAGAIAVWLFQPRFFAPTY
ncbi:MAG: hypothetical protein HKN30_04580 [Sulfitobacter sp.]|nr:hypothetical protein [Sulfitobacter sp.]